MPLKLAICNSPLLLVDRHSNGCYRCHSRFFPWSLIIWISLFKFLYVCLGQVSVLTCAIQPSPALFVVDDGCYSLRGCLAYSLPSPTRRELGNKILITSQESCMHARGAVISFISGANDVSIVTRAPRGFKYSLYWCVSFYVDEPLQAICPWCHLLLRPTPTAECFFTGTWIVATNNLFTTRTFQGSSSKGYSRHHFISIIPIRSTRP